MAIPAVESNEMLLSQRRFEIPSSILTFLKIECAHKESDLQIVCYKFGSEELVTFYVHREILMQKCSLFADSQNFALGSQRSCHAAPTPAAVEELIEYDDDIVYEVLRFVYTGMLCPLQDSSRRALQLLKLVDYLGIFEMAVRHAKVPNILRDEMIGNILRRMLPAVSDNSRADSIRSVVCKFCQDGALGFQLKQALMLRLMELQPIDQHDRVKQHVKRRLILATFRGWAFLMLRAKFSDVVRQVRAQALGISTPNLDLTRHMDRFWEDDPFQMDRLDQLLFKHDMIARHLVRESFLRWQTCI